IVAVVRTDASGLNSGDLFPAGTTTISYSATDSEGNVSTCSFDITVDPDGEAPVISGCPADIGPVPMDAGACGAIVNFVDPTANDNCDGIVAVVRTDASGLNSGDLFPAGATTISYSVTDAQGNVSTCSFDITVDPDGEAPVISDCPADQDPVAMDAGVCGATINWTDPTASDNCDGAVAVVRTDGTGLNSGDVFPAGITVISYSATDAQGNVSTCSFNVNIPDTELPVLTCVTDQAKDTDPGVCSYTVVGTEFDATATDNCTVATLVNDFNGGATLAGETIPAGTTTITWTATDGGGNISTCQFDITVTDIEVPLLVTLDTIVNIGLGGTVVIDSSYVYDAVASSDNCGISAVSIDVNTFTCTDLGSNTVNITMSDAAGNSVSGTATVTVTDTTTTFVSAGNDEEMCITDGSFTITSASQLNGNVIWGTTGDGTFDDPTLVNPTYILGATDSDSVKLYMDLTAVIGCKTLSDTMKLTIYNAPSAFAGNDIDLCGTPPDVTLSEAVCTNGTVLWTSSGDGSFDDPTAPNPVYTFGPSDIGPVVLTVAVTGPGTCGSASDDIEINFIAGPTADAGADDTVCGSAADYPVTDAVSSGGSVLWTSSGDGTFDDDAIDNPVYTFGSADLSSGSVTLTMTVNGGGICPDATDDKVITISPLPGITVLEHTDISCNGLTDGIIRIEGAGGTAPYVYSIDGGAYDVSGDFTGLSAATYLFSIQDQNGCVKDTSITIVEPASLTMVLDSVIHNSCYQSDDAAIYISAAGGTEPYIVSWTGPDGYSSSNLSISGLEAGLYSLNFTDANNCAVYTLDTTIVEPAQIVINPVSESDFNGYGVSCNGSSDGFIEVSVSGGTGPLTISWTGPDGFVSSDEDIVDLAAGDYSLTVTDSTGCSETYDLSLLEPAVLELSFSVTDAQCPGDNTGEIDLSITGGVSPYTVLWSDGDTGEDRIGISDGAYTVEVSDANGCTEQASITVGVLGINCIRVPEIITPGNVDGKNDFLVIQNIDIYPNAEIRIFSRWGKLVYSARSLNENRWDGTFKGKPLPVDSYHYILDLGDGTTPLTGTITIIR
ncbi:MAG: HYR domain-containing protein, partial [Marinilabiliaceae bacterium]|nr:HYR domain-containing protein [Marinilabiliaceae bacterium]